MAPKRRSRRRSRRLRRYRLAALFAWRGARTVKRHRRLGALAWRGARWYRRPRRIAVSLAFTAALALGGALGARRRSRRPPVS